MNWITRSCEIQTVIGIQENTSNHIGEITTITTYWGIYDVFSLNVMKVMLISWWCDDAGDNNDDDGFDYDDDDDDDDEVNDDNI